MKKALRPSKDSIRQGLVSPVILRVLPSARSKIATRSGPDSKTAVKRDCINSETRLLFFSSTTTGRLEVQNNGCSIACLARIGTTDGIGSTLGRSGFRGGGGVQRSFSTSHQYALAANAAAPSNGPRYQAFIMGWPFPEPEVPPVARSVGHSGGQGLSSSLRG